MRLLLASENAKKRAELALLLGALDVEVLTPAQCGGLAAVDEDQPTFAGNAAKKASAAARARGLWALADDSGLEVEALGGAPGVRSARFAGEPADDAANNAKLLRELAAVPPQRRTARFVCALALARPDGSLAAEIRGEARGRVLAEPRGASGFGYDPLFEFDEPGLSQRGRTFAELGAREKSAVSHRGRALRELARRWPEILAVRGAARPPASGADRAR